MLVMNWTIVKNNKKQFYMPTLMAVFSLLNIITLCYVTYSFFKTSNMEFLNIWVVLFFNSFAFGLTGLVSFYIIYNMEDKAN